MNDGGRRRSSRSSCQPGARQSRRQNKGREWEGKERRGERTAQTKHSQCHFPPNASSASCPSLTGLAHFLHFGARNLTWHASQYGCPLYTVNATPSPSSPNAPSPENVREEVGREEGRGCLVRNGSPHSAQKKCCSWYERVPRSGSSSVMNRSSTMAVLQW